MAALGAPINLALLDPTQSEFTHVPSGDYRVMIVESEVAPVKGSSNSGYLKVKYRITQGEFAGSVLRPDIWNIYNTNETAKRIGEQRMAAVACAIGIDNQTINDTAIFHNKEFAIRVIEEDNSFTDRDGNQRTTKQNRVTTILTADGKMPRKNGNPAPAAASVPTGGPPPGAFQPSPQPQPQPQQPVQQAPQPQVGQGMPPAGWQPQAQPQQPQQAPQPAAAPAPGGWPGANVAQAPQQPSAAPAPAAWQAPPSGAWGGPG